MNAVKSKLNLLNRELGALEFNRRVLSLAQNLKIPLLERLKYICIVSSNMDEFFEITTWGQLGLHTKPIGILNSNGYYDALIEQCKVMVEKGFLKQEEIPFDKFLKTQTGSLFL